MTVKSANLVGEVSKHLRQVVLETSIGECLGNIDELACRLGASRGITRLAARLLVRENLLRLKTGRRGGYFSTRPAPGTMKAALVEVDSSVIPVDECEVVKSAVRRATACKAASIPHLVGNAAVSGLLEEVSAVTRVATFRQLLQLDNLVLAILSRVAKVRFLELVWEVVEVLAARCRLSDVRESERQVPPELTSAWRVSTLAMIESVVAGDPHGAADAAETISQTVLAIMSLGEHRG